VDGDEPSYVAESPPAIPGTGDGAAPAPGGGAAGRARVSWVRPLFLAAAGVVIVAIGLITIARNESNAPPEGQASARAAAQQYVSAVNAGNRSAAVAASCPAYADEARAEARSGSDPGISFVLGSVHPMDGGAAAQAQLTERLRFTDATQRVKHVLTLNRSNGRWLVCGQH
jgi:hypothetical protein